MFGFGILSGLTFLPLVGAAFILTQRGDRRSVACATFAGRRCSTTIATFVLSLVVWQRFDASSAAFQLVEEKAGSARASSTSWASTASRYPSCC